MHGLSLKGTHGSSGSTASVEGTRCQKMGEGGRCALHTAYPFVHLKFRSMHIYDLQKIKSSFSMAVLTPTATPPSSQAQVRD